MNTNKITNNKDSLYYGNAYTLLTNFGGIYLSRH